MKPKCSPGNEREQLLIDYSRQLRKNQTAPEQKLWHYLRKNQMGVKFRRQAIIGPYIVDFYCPTANLVVEIDGDTHASQAQETKDGERREKLQRIGIFLLRFTNKDVWENIEGVYSTIQQYLESIRRTPP